MIHHISVAANNPRRVAAVIAELLGGVALEFPPFPGSYIAIADDEYGTAVEVSPHGTELAPGGEGAEVQARANGAASPLTATHAAITVAVTEERIRQIAAREGWRVERFSRGGAFDVLEFWIEGRLLFELLTPEMAARYLEAIRPEAYAAVFGVELPRERLAA
jgi:hypothetical protein